MNKLKAILDITGEPATLENLAEECVELAHAALKLARIKRGENPTPAAEEDVLVKLHAEMADVMCVIMVLMQSDWFDSESVDNLTEMKQQRWMNRLKV